MELLQAGAGSAAAPARVEQRGAAFYRFTDAQGRVHIVDSWSDVPSALRSRAERIELSPVETSHPSFALPERVDWPSFALGVGAALGVAALYLLFRSRFGLLGKFALGALVVVVLSGAYLGLLRRSTGQSQSLFSSPSEIIEDARRTVDKVNQHREREEKILREIERESK